MHDDIESCLLTLSLTKYVGSDDGMPTEERIDSISYIVKRNIIWLGSKYRISLCLRGMILVKRVR